VDDEEWGGEGKEMIVYRGRYRAGRRGRGGQGLGEREVVEDGSRGSEGYHIQYHAVRELFPSLLGPYHPWGFECRA
jgi:hypothetical protein